MYNVLFSFDPHQPGHKGEVEGEEGDDMTEVRSKKKRQLSSKC